MTTNHELHGLYFKSYWPLLNLRIAKSNKLFTIYLKLSILLKKFMFEKAENFQQDGVPPYSVRFVKRRSLEVFLNSAENSTGSKVMDG